MKKLHNLDLSRLLNMEFGQHAKSIYTHLTTNVAVTDTILQSYLNELNTRSNAFDKGMIRIAKSDDTAKITVADNRRDHDIVALFRYHNVFEFSENAAEKEAYTSLSNLFSNYKDLPRWNLERETNGINNMLDELKSPKYESHVDVLKIDTFIQKLETSNAVFVQLFSSRTEENATREIFDMRQLRINLKVAYNDLCGYVLTMAKAKEEAQYNESLNYLNTVRKYYDDLLSKRGTGKNEDQIPPTS